MVTALFVVLAVEQWKQAKAKGHAPALCGVCCGVVCLLVFGPDLFLIPALGAIVAAMLVLRPRLEAAGEGASS